MAQVKIGQASIGEGGKVSGGQPGDQTGKETNIKDWYAKGSNGRGWDEVIRHVDPNVGKQAADVMTKLINSNLVGYDQGDRNTLFNSLKKFNWDVNQYISSGTKSETDCSAFCYTCYCCVVPELRKSGYCPNTAGIWDLIHQYAGDKFKRYTEPNMLSTSNYCQVGDIINRRTINRDGHALMVVSTNGTVPTSAAPVAGSDTITTDGYSSNVASSYSNFTMPSYGPNTVYKLSSTGKYRDNVLNNSGDRKSEFEALRNKMTSEAPQLGRTIIQTSELYDANILKGPQESKTDRGWLTSRFQSSSSTETKKETEETKKADTGSAAAKTETTKRA